MEQQHFELISALTTLLSSQAARRTSALAELLSQLAAQQRNKSLPIEAAAALVADIESMQRKWRHDHRDRSPRLNVMRMFRLSEAEHSMVLAYLLEPSESHGQGTLFLEALLRYLGLADVEAGAGRSPWVVTAERGRVDVLIRRRHPHAVVVIENKSNHAVDQAHQLYRYWHQEIYRKRAAGAGTTGTDALAASDETPSARYRVVYLTPEAWKLPEAHSWQKSADWPWATDLPGEVPDGIRQIVVFRDLMTGWLQPCLERLPKENHRLREFVQQYIDFWN